MSRLFLLLAVAAVVYLLFRSYRKNAARQDAPGQDKEAAEDMVRCAQCGVHLPKSESIHADGRFYCSAEHREVSRK